MTSSYRRDHITDVLNDEFERLSEGARVVIVDTIAVLDTAFPGDASEGERTALRRACARYLIDSGKASIAGVV